MLIAKTKSGQLVDKAPASGVILVGNTTNEELVAMMNAIIGGGIPEDKVHTLFFGKERVGVVKIEPCAAIERRGKPSAMLVTKTEKTVQAIHLEGTYVCLWANYMTVCSLDNDNLMIWFRTEPWMNASDGREQVHVVVEYRPLGGDPVDLIKIRLISARNA